MYPYLTRSTLRIYQSISTLNYGGKKLTAGFDQIQHVMRRRSIGGKERHRVTMLWSGQSGCKTDGLSRRLAIMNEYGVCCSRPWLRAV